ARHPIPDPRLERELAADFDESSAHDLYCVPPLVIRRVVPRLLVEDRVFVESVVNVDVRLHSGLSPEREEPAETKIQLFDPLPVERVVWDQIDRRRLITCGSRLAGGRDPQ